MKYVQNNGRYALAFTVTKGDKEVKVVFDRKRFYLDTGNIATTGITAIEDDVYEQLTENKRFKKLLDSGEFALTDETKLETTENKVKALEEANKKLQKELKEAKKQSASEAVTKQLKDKDKEINDLKAQLEALTKGEEKKDETEGF